MNRSFPIFLTIAALVVLGTSSQSFSEQRPASRLAAAGAAAAQPAGARPDSRRMLSGTEEKP